MQERNPQKPNQSRNSRRKRIAKTALPAIPDKRYFTIGEASVLCGVKPHVLRYWEEEFPQLKPVKRRGNRRYYQNHDIVIVRQIRELLYENGFTIEGARAKLTSAPKSEDLSAKTDMVKEIITNLESVLQKLKVEEAV